MSNGDEQREQAAKRDDERHGRAIGLLAFGGACGAFALWFLRNADGPGPFWSLIRYLLLGAFAAIATYGLGYVAAHHFHVFRTSAPLLLVVGALLGAAWPFALTAMFREGKGLLAEASVSHLLARSQEVVATLTTSQSPPSTESIQAFESAFQKIALDLPQVRDNRRKVWAENRGADLLLQFARTSSRDRAAIKPYASALTTIGIEASDHKSGRIGEASVRAIAELSLDDPTSREIVTKALEAIRSKGAQSGDSGLVMTADSALQGIKE